jgi:hypothetical protein
LSRIRQDTSSGGYLRQKKTTSLNPPCCRRHEFPTCREVAVPSNPPYCGRQPIHPSRHSSGSRGRRRASVRQATCREVARRRLVGIYFPVCFPGQRRAPGPVVEKFPQRGKERHMPVLCSLVSGHCRQQARQGLEEEEEDAASPTLPCNIFSPNPVRKYFFCSLKMQPRLMSSFK